MKKQLVKKIKRMISVLAAICVLGTGFTCMAAETADAAESEAVQPQDGEDTNTAEQGELKTSETDESQPEGGEDTNAAEQGESKAPETDEDLSQEEENTEKAAALQSLVYGTAKQMGYEDKLFDDSYVHTVNIEISDADWEDLKKNAQDKTKYDVNITIDGETVKDVSFATKGNSSLSSVYSSGSSRFSFKVNFGKFIDDQTYYGLDKMSLSNIYLDATYMKDFITYRIFEAAGVPSPLTSYVALSINGEYFGLYLAIEDEGDSFLERMLNDEGELYKPEGEENNLVTGSSNRHSAPAPGGGGNGGSGGGAGGMNSSGVNGQGTDFKYIDDSIESYGAIFDNCETKADEDAQMRVIEALKALSEGRVEDCLDTDEIIRYFAAHNFTVNYDSMTGNRTHNYYLYENNGILAILPWDYNEAYGAHGQVGKASDVVNSAIDTPLSGPTEEERPVWSWIVSDEQYLNEYHEVMGDLIRDYFQSGQCAADIDSAYEMIRPYVETDPTAFYTVEQFDKAYETFKTFCRLRAESIQKQLDGSLAASTDEQQAEDLVDASSISIGDMGGKTSGGR